MNKEKSYSAISGYLMLLVLVILIPGTVFSFSTGIIPLAIVLLVLLTLTIIGFTVVNPNESCVLVLFGAYRGTIKKNGFFWVNPFLVRKKISLRARNFDSETIKVNDMHGNPIKIGCVLVWKVEDTFKAAFEVDDFERFVFVQSETALRKLAGSYPYDNFEDHNAEITLRGGGLEVNEELENEIKERLEIAGIKVIEARINFIAYSEEIAGAMLRRQQATAVVAARFKIVEGAVSMVQMALQELMEKEIVDLDDDKKAAMVSNLMVVLCGDKDPSPVVNTGTLHQ
ncbi:MAG TPA: SPFH domain-containing protein [Bacteroides sp.]|nr:SPFH domain-containing protein [Bacteroides sp.]